MSNLFFHHNFLNMHFPSWDIKLKTKAFLMAAALCFTSITGFSQRSHLAPTPPMGYMTWNFYADHITEQDVKSIADAMVTNGLVRLGYDYIFIDDGWQGGRDNRNNIIPDPIKFPSGIKALADYVHSKGIKLGIYSDAAPLTCAGYTASLHFEQQDAKTFASWGIDYLKYDYCGAPSDKETAMKRYKTMADALSNSGRDIVFGICEWGGRQPWTWGSEVGGNLWRIDGDIRDKWSASFDAPGTPTGGIGILDAVNRNADLVAYAKPGAWNDPDMLVVGLYGKKGPSGDLGGIGCNDIEYQSQMSLWCLQAAPLMVTCDVANMNAATKRILTNKEILAIDQDPLGKQAERKINDNNWQVYLKTLSDGSYAIGMLNTDSTARKYSLALSQIGLSGKYTTLNVWTGEQKKNQSKLMYEVKAHETIVLKLKQ